MVDDRPKEEAKASSSGLRHRSTTGAKLAAHASVSSLSSVDGELSMLGQQQPCFNYGTASEYADAVRRWLCAHQAWTMAPVYAHHQAMAQLSAQMATTQQQLAQQQAAGASGQSNTANQQPSTPTIVGGREYQVASFGRRIAAELVDFVFCFALKLVMVYFLVECNIIDIDKYDALLSDKADLHTLINVTQDLFPLELLNKLITSLIEAAYVSYGCGAVPPGKTPGKVLLGLKVICCDEMEAIGPPNDNRVLIRGNEEVDFKRSFMRSVLKNMTLSFMFPLCIVMYAFRYNRAMYEVFSKTIVVQAQ